MPAGGSLHSPLGSGELSRSQVMGHTSPHNSGRISPGRSGNSSGASSSWAGGKGGGHKFPASSAAAAVAKQLVDRACSPLTPGSIPPGEAAAGPLPDRVQDEAGWDVLRVGSLPIIVHY